MCFDHLDHVSTGFLKKKTTSLLGVEMYYHCKNSHLYTDVLDSWEMSQLGDHVITEPKVKVLYRFFCPMF